MTISSYLSFMKSNGIPLVDINPDSDDFAFSIDNAFKAIDIIKKQESSILGGDILTSDEGKLVYAHELWGSEYHYLNWYCDKIGKEDIESFSKRSYKLAEKGINEANKIAQRLEKDCFIVFVIK